MNNSNKEQINTCHTCNWPIYKGEYLAKSTTSSHSGSGYGYGRRFRSYEYSGSGHSDQWIQCRWCIEEYTKEKIRHDDFMRIWSIIKWIIIATSTVIFSIYGYYLENERLKNLPKNVIKPSTWYYWTLASFIVTFVIWKLLWNLLLYDLLAPVCNRYSFRIRKK